MLFTFSGVFLVTVITTLLHVIQTLAYATALITLLVKSVTDVLMATMVIPHMEHLMTANHVTATLPAVVSRLVCKLFVLIVQKGILGMIVASVLMVTMVTQKVC